MATKPDVQDSDIAIVGMSLRVPGARNPREYWRNLREGRVCVRELSDDELIAAGVTPREFGARDYVRFAAPLEGVGDFDPEFFGFGPKEGAILDPQHRHLYECAWEALEDAGHPPERFAGSIGVFAGCGMPWYFVNHVLTNPGLVDSVGLFLLRHTGNDKDFLATRISYCLDLKGPSVNVQTACSTSLVAVHLACQSLLSGECDMALAGGVTIEIPHGRGYSYKDGEILAPDGVCRPFDHRAAGTVFGSGAGIVVLRRLADALEDGDPIRAVIKGSAVNNDGSRKVGYLAPSVDGQAAAIVEALAVSGCAPDSIGYVEAHGTGTAVGDPIEIAALSEAYRRGTQRNGFCAVGSVKANIGHLDTAAGVASLVKTVLALEHAEIPPTPHFSAPNPTIDFARSPFRVAHALDAWPSSSSPRRAGVTSLGVGGTNAHLILEEGTRHAALAASKRPNQILCLSARTRSALDGNTKRLAEHLRAHPELDLADVAWTLERGRRAFGERRVLAAASVADAIHAIESNDARRMYTHTSRGHGKGVAFLFPGGGAQYVGMAAGLHRAEPVFRAALDHGIEQCRARFDLDLTSIFFPKDDETEQVRERALRPSIQLPAIFLVEYALTQLWRHRGVIPSALIGHSLGENTAACIAGVASFDDTLLLVRRRGELFERVQGGGMLSVSAGAREVASILPADLDLATVNAPALCVVSGPAAALREFGALLAAREIEARPIPIAIAAHSRLLEPILADFERVVRSMRLHAPTIPFVSNRTGTWITDAEATDPRYWVGHLRNTVQFAEGLETLLADEGRALVEVGPGKILSSLVRAQASFRPGREAIPSMRHADESVDDALAFSAAFGRLWAAGVDVDLARAWEGETRRRVSLPTYAFDHRRCWIEPGRGLTPTNTNDEPQRLDDLARWFHRPAWREECLDPVGIESAAGTWLVFLDRTGVGAQLVARLRKRGATVVTVRDGDAFGRVGPDEFVIAPERGREDYDTLITELAADGRMPSHVVHLWLVTKGIAFRPGSSFFHRNQEQGFYSLLFLAQALADQGSTDAVRMHVVSTGMQRTGDESLPHPDKATVLGPCRVIPRELGHVACASVDVEILDGRTRRNGATNGRAGAGVVDELETELLLGPCRGTVAWRHGRRFVQRYEARPIGPRADASPSRVRERGVYLVTGGLGGIGLALARSLAETARARLVLLTRGAWPDRSQWARIADRSDADDELAQRVRSVIELERLGAEVLVATSDVTDVEGLAELADTIRARFGTLNGVFHAAGVLRDGLLQERRQIDVEEVFAPKIHGTLALEALIDRLAPEFTVVFSSTSAMLGPAGQIDYAAANAFLDAWAESRSQRGKPTIAVAWGIWSQVGMAARAARGGARRTRGDPISSPYFVTHGRESSGLHVFEARWSARSHWVLDEHRTLEGRALLPGTGYLDVARAALREIGEDRPFEIEDLVFVEPLFVPEDGGRPIRVLLRPSPEGHAFEVQSRDDERSETWRTHAQARILVLQGHAAPRVDPASTLEGAPTEDPRASATGTAGVQAQRLRFGPRWSVMRARRVGPGIAVARLVLDETLATDLEEHALHPAVLDVALHVGIDRIPGHDGELWVPMSFDRVRVHAGLEREVCARVRLRAGRDVDLASFDAELIATDGRVLVEVEGFTVKRLSQGFVQRDPSDGRERSSRPEKSDTEESTSPIEAAFRRNLELGIRPHEGVEALARVLANVQSGRVLVTSLDLAGLERQAGALQVQRVDPETKFARPTLASEYVAARDDVEAQIVSFWEDLLGVDPVGVRDDFFQLGGHSLIAVRLFTKIKKAFHVEFPISVLFEAPTIERCAELVKQARGPIEVGGGPTDEPRAGASRPRHRHLVAMHSGDPAPRTPFFLVAGMFGNVLNLRHLAHLVGGERPFYGVQARGLYGEDEPHETFPEMAAAYIAEMRAVQPEGPYLVGGFSGGGIAAYEMARQLLAAGERVAALVMLDTPLPKAPPLQAREKLLIHVQRARARGLGYFPDWVKKRVLWEREKRVHRDDAEAHATTAPVFHSTRIQAAFHRALDVYQVERLPIPVILFRPKLDVAHDLGNGRVVNVHRELLFHDNGWTPFARSVEVHEVPGDHDGMVLEPNVRVLAAKLRRALEEAERVRPNAEPVR